MKILYYNRSLFDQNKIISENKNFTDEKINLFKEANFFANGSAALIDRTGANEFIVPIKLTEIPKDKDNCHKSFKQLCEERAIELLQKGKRINILWSGGIDSTVALFSLINKTNDPTQLRVILTPDSIAESGNIFDIHINNKIPFVLESKVAKKCYFYKDDYDNFDVNKEIFTSGCVSDHLNSIIRITLPYEEKLWHLQYEEALSKFTSKRVIDFLNKSVKAFPKEIKTYIDFLKFYGFNFHWHKDKYYMVLGMDQKYVNCFDNFFDTDFFQKWSIWNNESTIIPNVLKKPQRDVIYELTGDKLYSYGKNKGMSSVGVYTNNNWIFLMENGSTINYSKYKNENIILQ